MNALRILFCIVLVFFSEIAVSDELSSTVSAKYRDNMLLLDLSIDNIGHQDITNLQYELFFGKSKVQGSQQRLESGTSYTKNIQLKVGELLPGNYHFPLQIAYLNDLGSPTYFTIVNEIIIGDTPLTNLTISTASLQAIGAEGIDAIIYVKNGDNFVKKVRIETISYGMIERTDPIEKHIDPKARREFVIPITTQDKQKATKANVIYIVSYTHDNRHYSEIASSEISISPPPTLFTLIFSQQLVIYVLASLILAALLILSGMNFSRRSK